MRKMLLLTTLTAFCIALAPAEAQSRQRPGHRDVPPIPPPWTRRPLVQIAIVLDTGSGMSGLIHQAKTEIWAIANEMLFTTKDGKRPIVQLAVLSDKSPWEQGKYASGQVFIPFTTNYYAIFSRLNRHRTGAGGECDRADAVRVALHRLQWSPYPEDFKAIFVVGDGWFTRSRGALASACREADDAGVILNTLYCGPYKFGISKRWPEAAYCAGGQYMGIDYVQRLRYTGTPLDKTILGLNKQLNETFRLTADRWSKLWKQQRDMDRDLAMVSKEAGFQRIATKAAKGLLLNRTDALLNDQTSSWGLEPDIKPRNMPPVKTQKELTELFEKERDRRDIQKQILELTAQRRHHLAARSSSSKTGRPSLSEAVIQIIAEQAQAKGFQPTPPDAFPQPPSNEPEDR